MNRELPVVRYDSDLAASIADRISIRADLVLTEAICHLLIKALRAEPNDSVLVEALWSAALVRYSRCFTSGKREPLDPNMLSHLPGDPMGTHAYYKNQRDKLIAHSVNSFEEVTIGVVLEDNSRVVGVAEFQARLISTNENGVMQLAALARELRSKIEPLIEDGKTRVMEEAKSLAPTELSKLDRLRYTAPEPHRAGEPRVKRHAL